MRFSLHCWCSLTILAFVTLKSSEGSRLHPPGAVDSVSIFNTCNFANDAKCILEPTYFVMIDTGESLNAIQNVSCNRLHCADNCEDVSYFQPKAEKEQVVLHMESPFKSSTLPIECSVDSWKTVIYHNQSLRPSDVLYVSGTDGSGYYLFAYQYNSSWKSIMDYGDKHIPMVFELWTEFQESQGDVGLKKLSYQRMINPEVLEPNKNVEDLQLTANELLHYYLYVEQYFTNENISTYLSKYSIDGLSNSRKYGKYEEMANRAKKFKNFMRPDTEKFSDSDLYAVLDFTHDWVSKTYYVCSFIPGTKKTVIVSWFNKNDIIYESSDNKAVQQLQIDPFALVIYFTEYDKAKKTNVVKKLVPGYKNNWSVSNLLSTNPDDSCSHFSSQWISPAVTLDHNRNMTLKPKLNEPPFDIIFATDSSIVSGDYTGQKCQVLHTEQGAKFSNFWKIQNDYYGNIFVIRGASENFRIFVKKIGESDLMEAKDQTNKTAFIRTYDIKIDGYSYTTIPFKVLQSASIPKRPNLTTNDVSVTYNAATVYFKNQNEGYPQPTTHFTVYYRKVGPGDLLKTVVTLGSNEVQISPLESDTEYLFSIQLSTANRGKEVRSLLSSEVKVLTNKDPMIFRKKIGMILGCLATFGAFIIFLISLTVREMFKKRKLRKLNARHMEELKRAHIGIGDQYDCPEFIKRSHLFQSGKEIGHGGFGAVSMATLRKGNELLPVAVKVLNQDMRLFFRECAGLTHLNKLRLAENTDPEADASVIIGFHGIVMDIEKPIMVMEYVENSHTLKDFLNPKSNYNKMADKEGPTISEKPTIVHQIAKGLAFLHSNSVIHRDLKDDNVLIYVTLTGLHVKVIDFGLAFCFDGSGDVPYRINGGICPPELFSQSNIRFSTISCIDMWQYGLLILDIYCKKQFDFDGKVIYPLRVLISRGGSGASLSGYSKEEFTRKFGVALGELLVEARQNQQPEAILQFASSCLDCWQPELRPSALDAVKLLEPIVSNINAEQDDADLIKPTGSNDSTINCPYHKTLRKNQNRKYFGIISKIMMRPVDYVIEMMFQYSDN